MDVHWVFIDRLTVEARYLYIQSVPKRKRVCITDVDDLTLYKERIDVYFKKHGIITINTLGKAQKYWILKFGGYPLNE